MDKSIVTLVSDVQIDAFAKHMFHGQLTFLP